MSIFLPHSEVRMYDPSGDSTIPSTSKKRKFEEMQEEAEEAPEEPVTPVVKSKKPKKEQVTEGEWENRKNGGKPINEIFLMLTLVLFAWFIEEEAAEEPPKKKKKKKKEADAEEPQEVKEEEEVAAVTEVGIFNLTQTPRFRLPILGVRLC